MKAAHRHPTACLLAALALQALACTPGPVPKARPSEGLRPATSAGDPSATAIASSAPKPSDTKLTSLTLRMGVALPASLVGQQAQLRLQGQGGLVAPPNSTLQINEAGIVSNNSGSLIANNSGNIMSNNSGSVLSNQGGNTRPEAAWHLLSQAGGQPRQLLQDASKLLPPNEPRLGLWFWLAILDTFDQFLLGYVEAKPSLDRWTRFRCGQARILPPPVGAELFALAAVQLESKLQELPLAGILTQEPSGLRLRLVVLPEANAPVAEGTLFADLAMQSDGSQRLNFRFFSPLQEALGVSSGLSQMVRQSNGNFVLRTGEKYLPKSEQLGLAQLIHGERGYESLRRRLSLESPRAGQQVLRNLIGAVSSVPPPSDSRLNLAFGFSPPGESDLGVAAYTRLAEGPVGEVVPYTWMDLQNQQFVGDDPPLGLYVSPQQELSATPSSDAHRALLPDFTPGMDAAVPKPPALGEDPSLDPDLAMESLPAKLLEAPGALP